jgi:hypothetical protein
MDSNTFVPPPPTFVPLTRMQTVNEYVPLRSDDFNEPSFISQYIVKSKLSIVKESLLKTYDFIKTNKETTNFIFVTFSDDAKIYSTIELPNITHINNVKDFINNIAIEGGTNFNLINQTNELLDSIIDEKFKKVKYLMSDGKHNSKEKFSIDKSNDTNFKIFDYTLGIGDETQYDQVLLDHIGKSFNPAD